MIEELAVHCVSAVVQSSCRQRGCRRRAVERREEDEDTRLLPHFEIKMNRYPRPALLAGPLAGGLRPMAGSPFFSVSFFFFYFLVRVSNLK
jgi:hypothetical protein